MQKMRILGLAVVVTMLAGSTIYGMDPNVGQNDGTGAAAPMVGAPAPKGPSFIGNAWRSFTQSTKAKWGVGSAIAVGLFGFVHRTNIFHGRKLTQPVINGLKKWGENLKKGDTGTIIGTIGVAAALGTAAYFMWGSSKDVSGTAGLKGIRGKSEAYWREWNLQQSLEERIASAGYPALTDRLKLESEQAQAARDRNTDPAMTVVLAEAYAKAEAAFKAATGQDTSKPFVDQCNAVVGHLQAYKAKVDASVDVKRSVLDAALDEKGAQFAAKAAAKKAAEAAKGAAGSK
jgi:hypothetical protein